MGIRPHAVCLFSFIQFMLGSYDTKGDIQQTLIIQNSLILFPRKVFSLLSFPLSSLQKSNISIHC